MVVVVLLLRANTMTDPPTSDATAPKTPPVTKRVTKPTKPARPVGTKETPKDERPRRPYGRRLAMPFPGRQFNSNPLRRMGSLDTHTVAHTSPPRRIRAPTHTTHETTITAHAHAHTSYYSTPIRLSVQRTILL